MHGFFAEAGRVLGGMATISLIVGLSAPTWTLQEVGVGRTRGRGLFHSFTNDGQGTTCTVSYTDTYINGTDTDMFCGSGVADPHDFCTTKKAVMALVIVAVVCSLIAWLLGISSTRRCGGFLTIIAHVVAGVLALTGTALWMHWQQKAQDEADRRQLLGFAESDYYLGYGIGLVIVGWLLHGLTALFFSLELCGVCVRETTAGKYRT
eukprot:m.28662 g.28662  ORF g.28662 m.28662 type:complete len:207 (-) comp8901_c0_seq1:84-704(-)